MVGRSHDRLWVRVRQWRCGISGTEVHSVVGIDLEGECGLGTAAAMTQPGCTV
jgi:hypothetical protein